MSDMLVKLYAMDFRFDAELAAKGIVVKRAYPGDKALVLDFVRQTFPANLSWLAECEYALNRDPVSCHIAVLDHQIVGFACYDATAKGFFGPTGVSASHRQLGIGRELLLRCLWSMREVGYGYAVIGWAAPDALGFYERSCGATLIPDSTPDKSVYRNMVGQG
ncbi:MAG: GNAT family N-acetyltransferase [Propionibacteriaceae bacterium]|jgi:GNAT superfamily N-acetyltransferase|nr:GNAT family N-acetyltransferase [Propionibacteriaceae bacterium]